MAGPPKQRRNTYDDWHAAHPEPPRQLPLSGDLSAPTPGYDDTVDHIANFFRAVETREHVVEDEVFGNNAAIACHMANHSYFQRSIATWDATAQNHQELTNAFQRRPGMSICSRSRFFKDFKRDCRRGMHRVATA